MDNVIYEPHPVSRERKAELRAKGLKIIDARFAPLEVQDAAKNVSAKPDGGKLTVEDIKAKLASLGVAFEGVTKKADLQALLDAELSEVEEIKDQLSAAEINFDAGSSKAELIELLPQG